MKTEEIIDLARDKIPLTTDYSITEMLLYQMLRNIYSAYDRKEITADTAREEKQLAIAQFQGVKIYESLFYCQAGLDEHKGCELYQRVAKALKLGSIVEHTHIGITCRYKVIGCIIRYDTQISRWRFSVELQDLKSNSITVASLDDIKFIDEKEFKK